MTTPTKTSDNRSINWKMMKKADAEAKILNAAIEANMIWSKIDISGNPSNISEEIVEESEVDEVQSEDEYDSDDGDESDNEEMIISDDEEFNDDDDNDNIIISSDEESEEEEEFEEDINRIYLEYHKYSDSEPDSE